MQNFDELNNSQKEAVLHTEGPLLIIAGAGAGKTKTLTYRILNLIQNGISPRNILAITFTNKAAKEMEERVTALLKNRGEVSELDEMFGVERPLMSTFHALGIRILRESGHKMGVSKNWSIMDESDVISAIKQAMTKNEINPKQFEPSRMRHAISRQKGNLVTAAEYAADAGDDYFPKVLASIWLSYEEIKDKQKSLDFDDLLLKPVVLFRKFPETLDYYRKLWKYIHIDEYQDTNEVQYELSKMLAASHKNICVVGDGDQNIYGWRGANIKNILNFEKDYEGAKVVMLEENYRSTQNILSAANEIIKKNKVRKEKNLFTRNGEGEKITVYEAFDENDEARFIARKSDDLIREGVQARNIAVLYRANYQSRALEEAFLRDNVPYQVLGVRFFERKEIKDVLCYLRAGLNPESLGDIKRIINVPPRGIGDVTIAKVFAGQEETLPAKMQEKVKIFKALLAEIGEMTETEAPSKLIKHIIKKSGLEDTLKNGNDDDKERLENIMELVTLATKYDIMPAGEGMQKLIEDAALATDQDSLMKDGNAVKLMTVHASKGLEFKYVFITGLENDLFPHKKFGSQGVNEDQEEEERRLFYVALTRAKEKLFLTYANMRTIFGSRQANSPSEFLYDISEELLEKEERQDDGGGSGWGGKVVYL